MYGIWLIRSLGLLTCPLDSFGCVLLIATALFWPGVLNLLLVLDSTCFDRGAECTGSAEPLRSDSEAIDWRDPDRMDRFPSSFGELQLLLAQLLSFDRSNLSEFLAEPSVNRENEPCLSRRYANTLAAD